MMGEHEREYRRVFHYDAYLMDQGDDEVGAILACDSRTLEYHGFRQRDRIRVERVREVVVTDQKRDWKHGASGAMREVVVSREEEVVSSTEYRLTKRANVVQWVEV